MALPDDPAGAQMVALGGTSRNGIASIWPKTVANFAVPASIRRRPITLLYNS